MKSKTIDYSSKITKWLGTPASVVLHSLGFVGIFALKFFGVDFNTLLLVLTTIVSLEAIYLALFIQMSINRQIAHLENIGEDTDDILEDTEKLTEDETV